MFGWSIGFKIARFVLPVVLGVVMTGVGSIGKFIHKKMEERRFDAAVTREASSIINEEAREAKVKEQQLQFNVSRRYEEIRQSGIDKVRTIEEEGRAALEKIPKPMIPMPRLENPKAASVPPTEAMKKHFPMGIPIGVEQELAAEAAGDDSLDSCVTSEEGTQLVCGLEMLVPE